MGRPLALAIGIAMAATLAIGPGTRSVQAARQGSDSGALQAVRAAVEAELEASNTDHTVWTYRDQDRTPGKDAVYQTIETPHGSLRRLLELGGKPLNDAQTEAETRRIVEFVNSPSEQAKAHRNDQHDDAQARAMLKMLPDAFLWTISSQDADAITLSFIPNPNFSPPDMQARVMGTMAGTMVIAKNGNRIRTLKGALSQDVNIGWGLLGRLNQGGTFQVERRLVGNGHWQITETHVHIGGHALLFHTIGQQEDEEKTEWKLSTELTLADAARTLHAM
ncbi:hypothetical protein [Bryocella elongata]|nr:hypothetical protein [Bryocella elongata]